MAQRNELIPRDRGTIDCEVIIIDSHSLQITFAPFGAGSAATGVRPGAAQQSAQA